MSNFRRIAVWIVVVVLVGLGGFFGWQFLSERAPAEAEPLAAVDDTPPITGTVPGEVSAQGQLDPVRHAALSFQLGGMVAEVLVGEGDLVSAGDPLLRLVADELETEVDQAQGALAEAQANVSVAEARVQAAAQDVATAEIGVRAAEAQLALCQADPLPEEIAAMEAQIASADAGVSQAAANQSVAVSGASGAEIASAEANVAAASAEVNTLQDQYDEIVRNDVGGPVEEQTRAALNAAQMRLAAAQAALNELRAGASSAERSAAYAGVNTAVANRDVMAAELDLLRAGPRTEEVTVAEVGVAEAEAAVTRAELAKAEAEAALDLARVAVTQAEVRLAAAEKAVEKTTLRAPFDGTVARLDLVPGEVVTAGVPVLTLADFSRWTIHTTDLTELEVVSLAEGDTARIEIDALPEAELQGTIAKIANASTVALGEVTYEVTVELGDSESLPLRWGMTVFIHVDGD